MGRTVARSVETVGGFARGVVSTVTAGTTVVPATATGLVVCLFVTVAAAPQQAAAMPAPSTAVYDFGQQYAAPTSTTTGDTTGLVRDGFRVSQWSIATMDDPTPDLPAGSAFVRPVDGSVPAAGGFGSRHVRGCVACSTNHLGLDFAAPAGTPIVSAMAGTVLHAGPEGGYGNAVVVQHADGVRTRYGHMSAVAVRVGQVLPAGGRIGSVGSTGVSTGAHLHFEVLVGTRPIDPAGWLRARGLL